MSATIWAEPADVPLTESVMTGARRLGPWSVLVAVGVVVFASGIATMAMGPTCEIAQAGSFCDPVSYEEEMQLPYLLLAFGAVFAVAGAVGRAVVLGKAAVFSGAASFGGMRSVVEQRAREESRPLTW